MKTKLTAAWFALVALHSVCPAAESGVNRYKTLAPAISTLDEAKRALGEIDHVETVPSGLNYHFNGVTVNCSGKDQDRIHTIIIWGDTAFKNSKGLGVGDPIEKIKALNPEAAPGAKYYADMGNGVIYWIEDSRIKRMVLFAP